MSILNNDALTSTDTLNIKNFIEAAMKQMQDMDDIKESLRETAKGIAEKLPVEMKPSILMKAARIAYKQSLSSEKDKFDAVEEILNITGNAN